MCFLPAGLHSSGEDLTVVTFKAQVNFTTDPAASKNDICFKSGQNEIKNNCLSDDDTRDSLSEFDNEASSLNDFDDSPNYLYESDDSKDCFSDSEIQNSCPPGVSAVRQVSLLSML